VAPDDLLRIEHRAEGSLWVLELHGELDLATAALLPGALGAVRRSGATALIVDLRGVSLLDSTGVRALLHVRRWMANRDGRATFVCDPEGAGRTLTLMGLYDALGATGDYEAALASAAGRA
jgi:anti-sigma B factor antagonist